MSALSAFKTAQTLLYVVQWIMRHIDRAEFRKQGYDIAISDQLLMTHMDLKDAKDRIDFYNALSAVERKRLRTVINRYRDHPEETGSHNE